MTQPLHRFAGTGSALESLHAHAERLGALQRLVETALPDHLAGLCHVANLKGDTLLIHADSGAVAAKLRQCAPQLLNALAGQGVVLAAIRIATRPAQRIRPEARPVTVRAISQRTRAGMDTLAATLPSDDPLRAALERFVRHSRGEEET
ncbi:MAG: DUF721 domain-containing protein [Rhodocyclaceae bacterium]|nr:DUF721 domain-containing protein [Rhodocyclaceae bacterium]